MGATGLMIWARRSWLSREKTALLCERKFPELNDGLISLVQLSSMVAERKTDFSLGLFELHLEQLEEKLNRIKLLEVAEPKRLRIPAGVFAGLLLGWVALLFLVPGFPLAMSQALALKGLSRVKGREALKVSRPLELYDLVMDYQFPAYSGLPPRHVEGGDGSVSGLVGGEVSISAKSPIAAAKAWIQLSAGGSSRRLSAEVKGKDIRAKLAIGQSGQYRFEAEDKDGKVWSEPEFNKISSIPDRAPEVELVAPDRDLTVNEEEGMTVRFRARDDYGLESVALVFSSRGREKRIELKKFDPSELEVEREYNWNLAAENFLPGEKVAYYIEAIDNNNVTGPGLGRSPTRYLEIFSPLKAHEDIIAAEQELFEKLIALLGKSLDADLEKTPAGKYFETESALLKQFGEVKSFLEALRPRVENDSYSADLIKEAIAQSLDQYRKLIADREAARNARNSALTAQLRKNTVSRLEPDILFWDKQLQKQRMDFLLALGDKLKTGQEELAKLMAQYARTKDPETLKQIEAKLDELKMIYSEFLARMAEMGQTVQDEFVNLDSLKKQGAGDVMAKLEKFRQSVHDKDVNGALSDANDFMAALDQMLGQLKEGSEKMGSSLSKETMAALESGMNKLKELSAAEEKLISETSPIYQKQLENQERALAQMDRQKQGLQAQLDQLSRALKAQSELLNKLNPPQGQDPAKAQEFYNGRNQIANTLWQMSRELEYAKKDLEQNQAESLNRRMANVEQQFKNLKQTWQKASKNMPSSAPKSEFESACNGGLGQAGSIRKDLDGMSQSSKGGLSQADQARLNGLSKQQAQVRGQLDQLMKELGETFDQLPVKPPKVLDHLGRAGLKMRDAEGELELNNPDLGLNAEKESKYWLEQAMNGMEKFMDKVKKNAQSGAGVGMNMPMKGSARAGSGQGQEGSEGFKSENFELPGADANKNPVELRKRILKAMRENSPKEYEDLIRDYYKRLVQ